MLLDVPVTAALLLGEEVLDGGGSAEVALQRALQLRLEVPMLKHLLDNLCGQAFEVVEIEPRLTLHPPLLPHPGPLVGQVLPVLPLHVDPGRNPLEHRVREVQQRVERGDPVLVAEVALDVLPEPVLPVAQVHRVPPLLAPEGHLPQRQQHLPPRVATEVVLYEAPLVVVAAADKVLEKLATLEGGAHHVHLVPLVLQLQVVPVGVPRARGLRRLPGGHEEDARELYAAPLRTLGAEDAAVLVHVHAAPLLQVAAPAGEEALPVGRPVALRQLGQGLLRVWGASR
mmetsp:Transcript_108080/g.306476  ORF Transcript_108080/g.306476 Transcript_108080/m.306476 type:complete len:285 (+) Transcript_108080:1664-2518(+)